MKKHDTPFADIIDATAQLRIGTPIGVGNVILGNVFLGPNVIIGNNRYIIGNTTVNHDCNIGSHSYFSSGCTLAGNVIVGERVRFDITNGSKANLVIRDDEYISPSQILIS